MSKVENLVSMAVFARIVETLSFTEAARSLQLSKSSVSREIAQLEIRLGANLLNRTTRTIEVTEVGLSYYQYCHRVLNEMKNAEKFIRNFHEEPIGTLHIVAPFTFGGQFIVPAVNHYIKRNIHASVDLDLTDRTLNVSEDDYDIAVVISRDTPEHPLVKPLTDISWGLYASPEYLSQFSEIEKPEDLPRYDYILLRGSAHTIALPFRKEKQKIDIEVRSRFRANNSTILLSSAVAGTGIVYIPDYMAREAMRRGELVRILPEWKMDTYRAWMLFKSEQTLSSSVKRFAEDLMQLIQRESV